MIVIDTGPVIANANRKDADHARSADLLRNHPGPLLLAQPLLTEIGYMLASRAGARAEADFLRDVADGVYELVAVTGADVARAADPKASRMNSPCSQELRHTGVALTFSQDRRLPVR